mmetsp:Transcript_67053/g.193755  ORF Transcript_67053/g.193755 Transcript_67053/m.193755 type:complete len:223 (+) Transcript_67053:252-920(+)
MRFARPLWCASHYVQSVGCPCPQRHAHELRRARPLPLQVFVGHVAMCASRSVHATTVGEEDAGLALAAAVPHAPHGGRHIHGRALSTAEHCAAQWPQLESKAGGRLELRRCVSQTLGGSRKLRTRWLTGARFSRPPSDAAEARLCKAVVRHVSAEARLSQAATRRWGAHIHGGRRRGVRPAGCAARDVHGVGYANGPEPTLRAARILARRWEQGRLRVLVLV